MTGENEQVKKQEPEAAPYVLVGKPYLRGTLRTSVPQVRGGVPQLVRYNPPEYSGFWIRLCAYLIDSSAIVALVSVATVVYIILPLTVDLKASGVLFLGAIVVITWLYHALFESSALMATPGKLLFGLKVTDSEMNRLSFLHASARYLGKFLSCFFFYFGYLMIAFTERKQALHDVLANTVVTCRR